MVGTRFPNDPVEIAHIALSAGSGGADLPDFPHLYLPYTELAATAARAARPLVTLAQRDKESAEQVNDFVKANGSNRSLGFLPIKARNEDFTAVVDRKTGEIVGYLRIRPW